MKWKAIVIHELLLHKTDLTRPTSFLSSNIAQETSLTLKTDFFYDSNKRESFFSLFSELEEWVKKRQKKSDAFVQLWSTILLFKSVFWAGDIRV